MTASISHDGFFGVLDMFMLFLGVDSIHRIGTKRSGCIEVVSSYSRKLFRNNINMIVFISSRFETSCHYCSTLLVAVLPNSGHVI